MDSAAFYRSSLLSALNTCRGSKDLAMLRIIHRAAVESGDDSNVYVANLLIHLYAKCGSMVDARVVFDALNHRTVVSWTSLISGYAEKGQGWEALDLFDRMRLEGCQPNGRTFVALLKACSTMAANEQATAASDNLKVIALRKGQLVHCYISNFGYEADEFTANTLVDMYANCGDTFRARLVFDRIGHRTVVSWNAMMFGYVKNGQGVLAVQLFDLMKQEDFSPNERSFVAALRACISLARKDGLRAEALRMGAEIRSQAAKSGCEWNVVVSGTLVDLYSTCGRLREAQEIFKRMERRTASAWNALVLGLAENGEEHLAAEMLSSMRALQPQKAV